MSHISPPVHCIEKVIRKSVFCIYNLFFTQQNHSGLIMWKACLLSARSTHITQQLLWYLLLIEIMPTCPDDSLECCSLDNIFNQRHGENLSLYICFILFLCLLNLKPFFFITCWSVVLFHYYDRLNVGTSKLTQAVPQLMFWKVTCSEKGRPYNCTAMCNNHVIPLLKVPTFTWDTLLLHRVCGLFKLYSKAEKEF